MESVTITLQRFLEMNERIQVLEKRWMEIHQENISLQNENENLMKTKELLMKHNIDQWKLEHGTLEQVADINGWHFALNNNKELMEVLTEKEMVEFITEAKKMIEDAKNS